MPRLARTAIAAACLAGAPLSLVPLAHAAPKLSAEEQLAKQLEGRVAGEPVNCIHLPSARSSRVYDKLAIVYDAGSVLYVNRPRTGASSLDDDDILVTTPFGSQLCSVDTVQLIDRNGGFWNGFVALDRFVPYRRIAPPAAAN